MSLGWLDWAAPSTVRPDIYVLREVIFNIRISRSGCVRKCGYSTNWNPAGSLGNSQVKSLENILYERNRMRYPISLC